MADQGVDLIVTSGGLGPDRRRHDGRDGGPLHRPRAGARRRARGQDRGDPEAADGALQPLGLRRGAGRQPQAGADPGGRVRDRPGRHGARRGGARARRPWWCCPGPPRELQPMWRTAVASEPVREAIAGRTEYRQEMVRMFGLPESGPRGHAARRRGGHRRLRRARDHHLPAARRDRDGHALRAAARRPCTRSSSTLLRERHGREIFSEDGSSIDDQVAAAARGPPDRHGGVVHGRAAGGAPHRAARVVRRTWRAASWRTPTRRRWSCWAWSPALIEPHGAVSEPVADAMAEGALRALRRGHRGGDHGHRGPGRRNGGEAGGHGLLERQARRGPRHHAHAASARRPGGHPRPLDDGGDAPAAARALRAQAPTATAAGTQEQP